MKYDVTKLKQFCTQIMCNSGLSEADSAAFADSLVNADMRGVSSHGVTRLKTYYRRAKEGFVDPKAVPAVVSESASLIQVDGNNAMGVVSASFAMRACVQKAKQSGACFAAVRGGNHFGYAAYFAEQACREGMIGIAMANGPVAIPPIGGKEPVLGTNPLAIAVPAKGHLPLVLDMATSVAARGKIKLAEKEGKEIPLGWAIDASGHPTKDPAAVKCVMPFGGPKGFAIALFIDILCSCASGAKNSRTLGSFYDFSGKHQDSGFFVGTIDISKLLPLDEFAAQVDAMIDSIKESPKADGVNEIFMPGEIEFRKMSAAAEDGVEIGPAVVRELVELAEECGVAFDCAK